MKEEKFDFEAFKKEAMNKLKNKEPGVTAENLFRPLFKRTIYTFYRFGTFTVFTIALLSFAIF